MIDKEMLRNFRKDFAEAVKDLEQQYGLVIELGKITYDVDSFEGKITAKEGDSKEDINQAEWNKHCGTYGLRPEDFDKRITLTDRGVTQDYIITGIRPNKRKYPICLKRVSDGTNWGWTPGPVRDACRKED